MNEDEEEFKVFSDQHEFPYVFPEVDDPSVSDEALGIIMRRYKGVIRPPHVIVLRPTWFEKLQVSLVVILLFLLVLSGFYLDHQIILNRTTGFRNREVECAVAKKLGIQSKIVLKNCGRDGP